MVSFCGPVLGEVFDAGGKPVTDELGQLLAKVLIEVFAGCIGIGIDVQVEAFERQQVIVFEKCGGGYRNGFVTGAQQRPTVAAAFGNVERLVWLQVS